MIAKYSFNTQYCPESSTQTPLPSLRLLEGGVFEPGQFAPVVIRDERNMRLRFFRWGFEPAWEAAGTERSRLHVISSDRVLNDPEFMLPIRYQRCLIPADGYYLKAQDNQYKLSHQRDQAFCFAGIYASTQQADGTMRQFFGLISTESLGTASQFGLQMPLILPKNKEALWLNDEMNMLQIKALLQSSGNHHLAAHLVEELQELNPYELYPQVAA